MKRKLAAGIVGGVAAALLTVGVASPANALIYLHQYADGGGMVKTVDGSTSYVGDAFNDKTTSLYVVSPSSYAVLWQHKNWTGVNTMRFYDSWDDLAYMGYTTSDGSNMDNRTSSVS